LRRFIVLLAIGAATVIAGSAAAAPPSVQISIHHQVKGCHSWAIGNGLFKPTQHLTAARGTAVTITDSDLMPHLLFQVSGPKVTLHTPNMSKPDAQASFKLLTKGTYVFKTKAGEDWVKGVVTKGEDNVLKLIVVVK
jgi:hypothetical protein